MFSSGITIDDFYNKVHRNKILYNNFTSVKVIVFILCDSNYYIVLYGYRYNLIKFALILI